ncbi:unnamed protein product [Oncorhynchus mykiss]|uniref:Uncharacterized protein n=1 Tax=Oncorhynchus mykiss TaxID=8022 RepID=A0A060Y998_ONCMY|nr:unnamed protein product [Oncorhynchus mykiss]
MLPFTLQCDVFCHHRCLTRHVVLHPQRSWYQTEEEYYLLLFSVAVCGLRFISFSLEHCWRPLEAGGLQQQVYWLTAYSFYHPLFFNGPILTFKDFFQQVRYQAMSCHLQGLPPTGEISGNELSPSRTTSNR